MSPSDTTVLKLPAGTIVSSPVAIEPAMTERILEGSYAMPKRLNRNLRENARLWPIRALFSTPTQNNEKSDASKFQSCIELHTYSQKPPGLVDSQIRERRVFFPSTSTSQISKTPDQPDGLGDIAAAFKIEEPPDTIAEVVPDALTASSTQAKASDVSVSTRLSLLRPPPLDLGVTTNFVYDSNMNAEVPSISQDNQGSRSLKRDGTHIIRPRFIRHDAPKSLVSPLTPLLLLNSHRRNASNFFSRIGQSRLFRSLRHIFWSSKPTDEIYKQVDDSMLDYRLVIFMDRYFVVLYYGNMVDFIFPALWVIKDISALAIMSKFL